MLNRLNVEMELCELKKDLLIKDFKLNDNFFEIFTLEENTLFFETNYETQYKFIKFISSKNENDLEKFINYTFETFESMLSSLSKLYNQRFGEILFNKLSNIDETNRNRSDNTNDFNDD